MRSFVIMAAASVCLALSGGLHSVQAQNLKKVRVGDVGATAVNWPVFVARDKGFFKAQGLDVEETYVGNVSNTVQQLIAGAFDIADSTFDSAIRGIAKGGNAVMIGGMTTKYPYSIMVAPSVHTLADLKGKKVILPFPKDLLTIVWNRWVKEKGMKATDIDQIYDGATKNRFNSLIAGAAQAALVTQPFDFRAAEQGYRKLVDLGDYAREYGFIAILGNPKWLKADPDAARAYLRAISNAIDWLYDQKNRQEAIDILVKTTKLDAKSAGETYDYYIKDLHPFSRGAKLPTSIVEHTFKTLVDIGDISPDEAKRAKGKLMDFSYLPK
jgi:ABC-type nitrate/sulfonate/bicarbonate transport system substrate-binding protein